MRRFNHPLDRLPQLEGLLRHGLLTKIMRRPPPQRQVLIDFAFYAC